MPAGARILACVPMPYSETGGFWFRDLGLITLTLREMGYDASLVTLKREEDEKTTSPVIGASMSELNSAAWWRSLKPDGIILSTWSAPRYDALRRAAVSSTNRVLEKLDTDGHRSALIGGWDYFLGFLSHYRESDRSRAENLLSPFLASARTIALRWFPFLLERPMVETMALIPVLTAESPIAAVRMERFLKLFLRNPPPVHCVLHPVNDLRMQPEVGRKRDNKVVSVGGWHRYQKDFPLLLKSLILFLESQPSWRAEIIGHLPDGFSLHEVEAKQEVKSRLNFLGPLSNEAVAERNQTSKIFFVSSRHESFHIAAAEALCCGCSVVAPSSIASMIFFVSGNSGTLSHRRSPLDFADALNAEVIAWGEGWRQPEEISKTWRSRVGAHNVAQRLLDLLNAFPPRAK